MSEQCKMPACPSKSLIWSPTRLTIGGRLTT